ncbi:hypothetical protein BDZ97DRAFT_2070663 [Flammula alnicola]|nr:hypothetical protein BDZ97DRAFT_2070663 [Flammula alnicola]
MSPMLDTIPAIANSLSQPPFASSSSSKLRPLNYHYLTPFFSALTPLTTTHSILFAPHLQNLLIFPPSFILPPRRLWPHTDCRPSISQPEAGFEGAFVFPSPGEQAEDDEERDERSILRLSALEFMISLSEARPNMARKVMQNELEKTIELVAPTFSDSYRYAAFWTTMYLGFNTYDNDEEGAEEG